MIIVLAGNAWQAQQWARLNDIQRDEYLYVPEGGTHRLLGIHECKNIVKVGTWYERLYTEVLLMLREIRQTDPYRKFKRY